MKEQFNGNQVTFNEQQPVQMNQYSQSMQPVKAMQMNQYTQPMQPVQPAQPMQMNQYNQSMQPVRPMQMNQYTQPVQTEQMNQYTQPTQYRQVNQYGQVIQPAVVQPKKSKKALIISLVSIMLVIGIVLTTIFLVIGLNGDGKDYTIRGNSASNLINGGFVTLNETYILDNNRKRIMYPDSNGQLIELISHDSEISNLLVDSDGLYYVCDGCIYLYSESKHRKVKELEKYKNVLDLFISDDYYFILDSKSYGEEGTLYRVSRKDYKEVQSIKITTAYITFLGDNFYYVDEDTQDIVMIAASDFTNEKNRLEQHSKTAWISALVSDGESIYMVIEDDESIMAKYTANLKNEIWTFDLNNFYYEIVGDRGCFVSGFAVAGNNVFISVYGSNNDIGLYHFIWDGKQLLRDNTNIMRQGKYMQKFVSVNVIDDVYRCYYYGASGGLHCVSYDAKGNLKK